MAGNPFAAPANNLSAVSATYVAAPLTVRFMKLARFAGMASAVVGAFVLLGWILHIDELKRIHPALSSMKANTALCFALGGMALQWLAVSEPAFWSRWAARVCAALMGLIALATLGEYAMGSSFGIDEWLFHDRASAIAPGRMRLGTAILFFATALGLRLLDVELWNGWRPAQWCASLVILGALLALLGFRFGATSYHAMESLSVALHTATTFLVLGLGLLFARPQAGFMRTLASDRPSGIVLRRMLPAVVLVSLTAEWVNQSGVDNGLFAPAVGDAVFAVVDVVCLAGIVLWASNRHLELHEALEQRETALRRAQLMARLAHVITAPDGSFESWSESLPALLGIDARGVPTTTRQWLDILHPEDRSKFRATAIEARAKRTRAYVEYRLRRPDGIWIYARQVMEPIEEGSADSKGRRRWFNTIQDITKQKLDEEQLRKSEGLKGAILESSLDCLITINERGEIVEFNPAAEATFGIPRTAAIGKALADLIIPPTLRDAHKRGLAHYLATGKGPILGKRLELSAIRADGTEFPIELAIVPIKSGAALLFTGFIRDITARKQAEARIDRLNRVYAVLSGINALIVRARDREELFREACRIAMQQGKFPLAWIGVVDPNEGYVKVVASAGEAEGYLAKMPMAYNTKTSDRQGIAGRAIAQAKAIVANDIERDPRVLIKKEALERGFRSLVALPLSAGGEVMGVLVLYAEQVAFFDEGEMKLLQELAGDISFALEHIEKAKQLDYLAYYDSLTGLANRTLFHERLEQNLAAAAREHHKLAVIMMDIERFKTINDSLGRQAGDALLKQVAERMVGLSRDVALLGRLDADHFAVLVPGVKSVEELARSTERRVRRFFDHAFRIDDTELRIAAKLGIALFPDDGADADALLRNAEAALKRAKSNGERYLFYAEEMTGRVAERLTLENKLRQALLKNQFVLHYQPKIDLQTRAIVGVEALIRWQSPELGLVPPMKFIPLLEETGLIMEVGSWALRRAALDHRGWVEARLKAPRIAVNVSPIQLRQRDFADSLEHAIFEGVAPVGIDLEITESVIMQDVEATIAKLTDARALGVNIAIDDFGTGYSSLAYLARLPVQTLKIDRSFVIKMLADPNIMTLVRTMLSLAHSLSLNVVAEGVDSEEQANVLRLLKCDQMQGYLFSKPLPLTEVTALLNRVVRQ